MKEKVIDKGSAIASIILGVAFIGSVLGIAITLLFYIVGFAKHGFDFMMSMF